MNEVLEETFNFLLYPEFTGWFLVLKIFFLGFAFYFFIFIIWQLVKYTWLKRIFWWDFKEILTYKHYGARRFTKDWREIKRRLTANTESEAKLAIIEADDLLDKALGKLGYEGEKLEDKLAKLTTDVLTNLEEVKTSHKIRNDIISDPTYKLDLGEARSIIEIYEKALTFLDVL